MSIIKLNQVSKFYYSKNNISSGFSKVSLDLDAGEFVVITGESGSGKSTLLNVISGLDSYEEGEMYINGEETSHYSYEDYEEYRRKYIGNIFQNFNLVNSYTVYQNIELVLLLNGYSKKEAKEKVLSVIKQVGLTRYKNTKASKLSGGQKQRVAIARALVKDTPIIVADEPTGNLDIKSAESIMKLLYEISSDKLVVIVTHNYEQVEKYVTRKITMHDGKIIMDKKIKEKNDIFISPAEYKNIKFINKVLLGIRNAFNIKTKFLLLSIVYLVLTLFVFSSYSALQKIDYDNNLGGSHEFFLDSSQQRIIINKKDKSLITDDDIDTLSKLSNVSYIVKDDIILDEHYNVYNDNQYFYGTLKSLSMIDHVTYGRLPINDHEIVISISKYDSFDEELLNQTFTYGDDYGNALSTVTLVGVNIDNDSLYSQIYLSEYLMNKAVMNSISRYGTMTLDLNGNSYNSQNDTRLYYQILPSKNVSPNQALVPENMEYVCYNYNCINNYGRVNYKTVYFNSYIDFRIADIYNEKNYASKTGMDAKTYSYNSSAIFINDEDYNSLFSNGVYQSSVYIKDVKLLDSTVKDLESLNYNVYPMKNMLTQTNALINSVMRILRTILFVAAVIVLFFISYFIIKIILKSRNSYFGTIRTLGASKGIARDLLNIELFVDINFIYIVFITLIILVRNNIIKFEYIKDMTTYFNLGDYILLYIMLVIMSLLIALRYARGLFKNTIMNAYREEV